MLPAASLSNVGIYGTGQAYEALSFGCEPTRCPAGYADLMLTDPKVVPSFLKRVDPLTRRAPTATWLMCGSMEALTGRSSATKSGCR